jgi:hypothetical protein
MKTQTIAAVAAVAMIVAGCAGRASSIAPVAIAATDYSRMSCETARDQLVGVRDRVNALTRQQNNAALADAAGVLLIFVPVGSVFGGDKSGELAQAKGEQLALERHILNNCTAA